MTNFFLAPSSYLAIILVLILAGSGLPVPEEVPVIAAGILSANKSMNPSLAFASCLFGAIVGDCVMYWVGYHFGRGVLRDHHWWARFVTPTREAKIERMFHRHGLKLFLLARFLVGLRSPVYLTAGILRVSFRRFFLIDLICATAVVGTFFGLTYLFGRHITEFVYDMGLYLSAVVTLLVAGLVFLVWQRRRKAAKMEEELESLLGCVLRRGNIGSRSQNTHTDLSRTKVWQWLTKRFQSRRFYCRRSWSTRQRRKSL